MCLLPLILERGKRRFLLPRFGDRHCKWSLLSLAARQWASNPCHLKNQMRTQPYLHYRFLVFTNKRFFFVLVFRLNASDSITLQTFFAPIRGFLRLSQKLGDQYLTQGLLNAVLFACFPAQIPPKVNQIFIGSTCLMGEELENFAKLYDIQLLTHHDSTGKSARTVKSVWSYLRLRNVPLKIQETNLGPFKCKKA